MSDAHSGNPNAKNIDPRKLTIILEIMKEAEGKSMEQVLPLLIDTNKRLQAQNLSFTKEENDLLMETLTKNLSPKERTQFDMIRRMIGNRK